MGCWATPANSYSETGVYSIFAVGAGTNLFWIHVGGDVPPTDHDVGIVDSKFGFPPGPVLFTLTESYIGAGPIADMLVDDRGPSPIFYVMVINDIGTIMYIYVLDSSGAEIAVQEIEEPGLFIGGKFIGFTDYGLVLNIRFTDFVTSDETFHVMELDGSSMYLFFNDSETWASPEVFDAQVARDGSLWLIYPNGAHSPNYSVILYDPDGNYVEEYDAGVPLSATSITLGYDCGGLSLMLEYTEDS